MEALVLDQEPDDNVKSDGATSAEEEADDDADAEPTTS
jgi:hypothetical protein